MTLGTNILSLSFYNSQICVNYVKLFSLIFYRWRLLNAAPLYAVKINKFTLFQILVCMTKINDKKENLKGGLKREDNELLYSQTMYSISVGLSKILLTVLDSTEYFLFCDLMFIIDN